jgi:hypothetical protein
MTEDTNNDNENFDETSNIDMQENNTETVEGIDSIRKKITSDFLKLKEFVDKFLFEEYFKAEDLNEIHLQCEVDIDIKNPSPEDFVEKLSFVGEYISYFISKKTLLESYIKTYDKYVDLLKVYLIIMSGKKKADAEAEVMIKLSDYCLKRQIYANLLSKISGRKEVFENKYTVLSRVLTFWSSDSDGSSAHTRFMGKKTK